MDPEENPTDRWQIHYSSHLNCSIIMSFSIKNGSKKRISLSLPGVICDSKLHPFLKFSLMHFLQFNVATETELKDFWQDLVDIMNSQLDNITVTVSHRRNEELISSQTKMLELPQAVCIARVLLEIIVSAKELPAHFSQKICVTCNGKFCGEDGFFKTPPEK